MEIKEVDKQTREEFQLLERNELVFETIID